LVFTGPGHFVLSQGVHAISEVRPKKIENRKIKTAEKEPWSEEAPFPWGKYRFRGLHGAASL